VEQWNVGVENDWTMRYALWAFHRVHYPRLMMINLPETDVLGHFSDDNPKVFSVLARRFNAELGDLLSAYRSAGILNRTDIIITADHGMATVQSRIPFSIWDTADEMAGATKVYLEADMGGELGIAQTGLARTVAANVARLGGSSIDATLYEVHQHGIWSFKFAYVKSDVPYHLRQAYELLADTSAADDGPNVIGVYAPGVTTGDRPARGYHWLAGHLGPQWPDQHIPMIVSGAGVRQGATSSYPARLVDVAPTIEHLLGVPVHTDGVILQDALTSADTSAETRQHDLGKQLYPVVQALEARAGS
jgi:arylsulfatase A-like enzyme